MAQQSGRPPPSAIGNRPSTAQEQPLVLFRQFAHGQAGIPNLSIMIIKRNCFKIQISSSRTLFSSGQAIERQSAQLSTRARVGEFSISILYTCLVYAPCFPGPFMGAIHGHQQCNRHHSSETVLIIARSCRYFFALGSFCGKFAEIIRAGNILQEPQQIILPICSGHSYAPSVPLLHTLLITSSVRSRMCI